MQIRFDTFAWIALLLATSAFADPPASGRTIYRCDTAAGRVFSDKPCGADARAVDLDLHAMNTYQPPPVATSVPEPRPMKMISRNDSGIAAEQAKHAAECRKIATDLDAIRDKMRTGYKVSEGERLKARERTLQTRRREEKCR
jgi:hypothetical protein